MTIFSCAHLKQTLNKSLSPPNFVLLRFVSGIFREIGLNLKVSLKHFSFQQVLLVEKQDKWCISEPSAYRITNVLILYIWNAWNMYQINYSIPHACYKHFHVVETHQIINPIYIAACLHAWAPSGDCTLDLCCQSHLKTI